MRLRFLLDDGTEPALAERLRHAGHDVECVVEDADVAPDAPDDAVLAYARLTDRIVITGADVYATADHSHDVSVFYNPDSRQSAETLFRIVQAVTRWYHTPEDVPRVVYLTPSWLE